MNQLLQLFHARGFTNDLVEPIGFSGACFQGGIFHQELVPLRTAGNCMEELFGRERFSEVIDGARFDRLDSQLRRGIRGDHQDG